MAQGDVTLVQDFLADVGAEIHNLDADVIKLGLITSVTTPTTGTANPTWGAAGTNWSVNQVGQTTGNYASGGPDISATYSQTTGLATFDATDVSILQHANNPTAARWGIIYNDTAVNKDVIGFIDLGGDTDMTAGDFTITWDASGIFTIGTIS